MRILLDILLSLICGYFLWLCWIGLRAWKRSKESVPVRRPKIVELRTRYVGGTGVWHFYWELDNPVWLEVKDGMMSTDGVEWRGERGRDWMIT